MRRTYKFVPACPRCGSDQTGYFIFTSTTNENSIIYSALKRGELVRVKNSFRSGSEPNCFCEECDMQWYGKIETLRLTKEEVEEERSVRKTNDSPTFSSAEEIKDLVKEKKNNKAKHFFGKMLNNLKPF